MSMIGKIISDDGYMIVLIRPFKDVPYQVGEMFDLVKQKNKYDLVKIFDSVITQEQKDEIMKNLNNARENIKNEFKVEEVKVNEPKKISSERVSEIIKMKK